MAQTAPTNKIEVQFKFMFLMGNNIGKLLHFYQDVLQVPTEGSEENGWADVKLGSTHMIYFKSDSDIPYIKEWAWQPGYKGGAGNLTSWSLGFPESEFRNLFERLKSNKIEMLFPKPEWRRDEYWGLSVKDPMGNTLELYTVPSSKPEDSDWK